MRTLTLTLAFLCAASLSARAQSTPTPDGPSWSRVQNLPAGVNIHVHGKSHSATCRIKTIDDTTLTCASHDGAKTEVFPKDQIKSIKISHRGRSTLVGAGIGAGIGVILGVATGDTGPNAWFTRGDLALLFSIPLAIVGALIGLATDFTVATIYRAP